MPLQLLAHRQNKFVGIFQRVWKELLQMSLQLIDEITYGYPVGDMLNSTKGITDIVKRIILFLARMIRL